MPPSFDCVLINGTVVNQDGIGVRDIGVRDGRIAEIGAFSGAAAGERIDCRGLHILPGVIDTQVHFREPGLVHKEDLETGSRAAVLGGVTAVFEMPNTDPLTVSADALADKLARAKGRMHCDFAFWVGGTHDNVADIPELERLPGAAGIKVFMGSSTGRLLVADDEGVLAVLKQTRRRAAFHSEDEARLNERKPLRVAGDPSSHPVWRDEIAALRSTERLIRLAREARAQVHVLHISTREEMEFLASAKDVASCEATPHHLTLSAEDYPRLGTKMQMNPPVRGPEHREAIWRGLEQGVVDVLGSDHAPHTLEEKAKPYPESPSGMTGVQTLVPIMLDHVNAGRLSLQRFVDLTSAGPQRLFGIIGKGRIAAGYDADFTIVDLKRRETIRDSWIASRSRWTPYDGKTVTGWPVGTIVRGRRVMWEGELDGAVDGRGGAVRVRATARLSLRRRKRRSPHASPFVAIEKPRGLKGLNVFVHAAIVAAKRRGERANALSRRAMKMTKQFQAFGRERSNQRLPTFEANMDFHILFRQFPAFTPPPRLNDPVANRVEVVRHMNMNCLAHRSRSDRIRFTSAKKSAVTSRCFQMYKRLSTSLICLWSPFPRSLSKRTSRSPGRP